MKQLLLMLAMLGMAAFSGYAKDVLSEITSASGMTYSAFQYNEDGCMVRQDEKDPYGRYYSLYTYNEAGQLVHNDTYQYGVLTPSSYERVYYIDYEYDSDGRLRQRENYNYDVVSGFRKGARIVYSYNDNNLLALQEIYLSGGDVEELFQKNEYIYDGNLLTEENSYMTSSLEASGFALTTKVVYEYNEDGYLILKKSYYYNAFGPNPMEAILLSATRYLRENNAIIGIERLSGQGTVTGKMECTFAPEAIAETIYPFDLEEVETNFLYQNIDRRLALCTEYVFNADTGGLVKSDEYTYAYSKHDMSVPWISVPYPGVYVTYDGGSPVLGGLRDGDTVTIVNAEGRCVAAVTAAGAASLCPTCWQAPTSLCRNQAQ